MKNIKYLTFTILLIGFSSCEKYLDVNDDPNTTDEASINFVLPAAQASTSIVIGGYLYNLGGLWAQYYTQSPDAGQYEDIDSYNVTADYFDDAVYTELYAGALKDYEYIKGQANEQGNNAYYLIATAMEGYTYQLLVDLYGQMPYSEALLGDEGNVNPVYDAGEDIYAAVLTNLNDALSRYQNDPSGPNPNSNDLIFSGNMDQWVRFANTLKLKMLMRASSAPGIDNSAAIMALVNEDNLLNDDATMTNFTDAENKRNPFYDVVVSRLGGINHAASNTMILFLQTNSDVRITSIYDTAADGTYTAKEQGDFENRDIRFDDLAEPIFSPDMPIYLFTAHEVDFLKAEAAVRFAGGAGAQAYYEEGVTTSYIQRGYTAVEAQAQLAGPYAYNAGGTTEDQLKQILTQKWVSMASQQNIEAFFELTRTGYPSYAADVASRQPGDLLISMASVLGAGQTPKRLLFPDVSRSRNPNVPPQPAGGIAAPVFWAQ